MNLRPLPLLVILTLSAVAGAFPLVAQPVDEVQRYRLAQGYERSNDLENASRVYRELLALDPQSRVYFDAVVRTLAGLRRYAELLPIVAERSERFPADLDLGAIHAALLYRTGARGEAAREWGRVLALAPDRAATYTTVAASQRETGDLEGAVATLEAGRAALGDANLFATELGGLLARAGRPADATREYLKLLRQGGEGTAQVLAGLTPIVATDAGAAAALATLREALRERADDPELLRVFAWLANERRDEEAVLEATRRLDQLRRGNGSDLFALADRSLREHNYALSLRALDLFDSLYPGRGPLSSMTALARTRALQGMLAQRSRVDRKELEEIAEQYERVAEAGRGGVVEAEALLARGRLLLERLDRPDEALASYEAAARVDAAPDLALEAHFAIGDLLVRQGDLAAARAHFEEVVKADESTAGGETLGDRAQLRLGELLMYEGDPAAAADRFLGLTNDLSRPVANDALAWLLQIREHLEDRPQALRLYGRGRLALLQRRWGAAADTLAMVASLTRGSALADEARYLRAEAMVGGGATREGVAALEELVAASPRGAYADRALFEAARVMSEMLDQREEATKLYMRLLEEYDRSTLVPAARQAIRRLREGS